MKEKFGKNQGFTLIELLIAMSIFLVFTGVLIGSYSSIVQGQREANEYRIMYVEARRVFEAIGLELRDGMVDYGYQYGKAVGTDSICIISKDAKFATEIRYENGIVKIRKQSQPFAGFEELKNRASCVLHGEEFVLNSEVNISNFKVYFFPEKDPYDVKNVEVNELQFQPKITIFAEFEKVLSNGKIYRMDLQTTVSSRIYNQVYPLEKINKL